MSATLLSAHLTQCFSVLDRTIVFTTDSSDVMRYFQATYRRLMTDGAAPNAPRDVAAIIYSDETTPRVTFNGAPVEMSSKRLDSPFHAAFHGSSKLFRLSMRLGGAWQSVYAAAVRVKNRAVLIAAPTNTGKTTLALELIRRGARLYGDEFVCIRTSDNVACAFPRTLMIREKTLALVTDARLNASVAGVEPRVTASGEKVWDFVDAGAVYGESVWAQPAPLGAAVLLCRGSGAQTSIERISPAAASMELATRFNTERLEFAQLAGIAQMFASLPCYRLSAGNPRAAAGALLETLG